MLEESRILRENGQRLFWFCLLVTFLVSATFHVMMWDDAPRLTPDGPSYMETARDLQDFRLDGLHDRVPGYPLLVLLSGSSQRPQRLLFYLQMGFHFASTLLLALVSLTLGAPWRFVLILAMLASLSPYVGPAAYLLAETAAEFTIALTLTGLLFWIARGHFVWLLTAALAGSATGLVRPAFMLLGVAFGLVLALTPPWVGFRHRVRAAAAVIALVPTISLMAFVAYNQVRFEFPGVTPLFGFNLSTRTVRVVERLPEADALYRDILIAHRDSSLVERNSDHTGYMSIWGAIPDLERATGLSRPELSRTMLRLNLALIRSAPLNYISEVLRACGTYWTPTPPEIANFNSRQIQLLWTTIVALILLLFAMNVLGVGGLLLLGCLLPRRSTDLLRCHGALILGLLLTLTAVFYGMLVSAAVETGDPRYRTPTDLPILVSIVLGLTLYRRIQLQHRA